MSSEDRIDEYRRRLDYQIEERRHIERLASGFIRIYMLIMGTLLTVFIAYLSGRLNVPNLPGTDFEQQWQAFSDFIPLLGTESIRIIWYVVEGLAVFLLAIGVFWVFMRSPYHALKSLRYEKYLPNSELNDDSPAFSEDHDSLVNGYEEEVRTNQKHLNRIVASWSSAQQTFQSGLVYSGVSISVLLSTLFYINVYVSIFSVVFMGGAFGLLYRNNKERFRPLLLWRKGPDTVLIAIVVFGIVAFYFADRHVSGVLLTVYIVFLAAIQVVHARSESRTLIRLSARNTVILAISTIFLGIIAAESPAGPDIPLHWDLLIYFSLSAFASIFVTVVAQISMGAIGVLWEATASKLGEHIDEVFIFE